MRELELKFSVHDPFTLPELVTDSSPVSALSRATRSTLRATYYDTDDLRLARSGITLRRRTGGLDAGWHLKLPIAGDHGARDEITAPLGGRAIPADLRELVTAYTRGGALKPVTSLLTQRAGYLLFDRAGQPVAELVDDTVSILDGTRVVERFREIEVESKGAKLKFLKKVGAELEAAGAVAGPFMPKAIRAIGSRAAAPPDIEAPGQVDAHSTAGDVVKAFLQTHVGALVRQDALVRQGADDSVHQMRVAARQLRSGLRTFGALVDAEWATGLRDELGWLASSLGAARDAEVMTARLVAQLERIDAGPLRERATAAVTRSLVSKQRRGESQLRAALTSERYVVLLDLLVAAAAQPMLSDAAAGPADIVLPPLARRAWRRLAKAVTAIDAESPAADLHRARIDAKRARYAAEACALAFGRPARLLAKQIVQVQDVLGEHQDSIIAADAVRRLAGSSAGREPDLGFALGVLYSMQLQAAERARAELPGVWREVRRRRHRAWLE